MKRKPVKEDFLAGGQLQSGKIWGIRVSFLSRISFWKINPWIVSIHFKMCVKVSSLKVPFTHGAFLMRFSCGMGPTQLYCEKLEMQLPTVFFNGKRQVLMSLRTYPKTTSAHHRLFGCTFIRLSPHPMNRARWWCTYWCYVALWSRLSG